MLLILAIWITSLFISSVAGGYYIKNYDRPDALVAVYAIYLALSQILAVKIGQFWKWTAPGAVLIFPFLFQITDMVNEYFGRKETHRMVLIAFITQVLMSLFLWMGNRLTPAPFWKLQETWTKIFSQSIRITGASWVSFLISNNFDAWLYDKISHFTRGKLLWVRSVLSDVPSLVLDSFIFVTLAFYGIRPVLPLIVGQLVIKWLSGVVDTPFIYLHRWIAGESSRERR